MMSMNELCKFEASATDEELGKITDVLFDDREWHIRYLVVRTGSRLRGREVLVSPTAAKAPQVRERIVPLDLDHSQVESSPPLERARTVSRQREEEIARHFRWPLYWTSYSLAIPLVPDWPGPENPDVAPSRTGPERAAEGGRLRSFQEVSKYGLDAKDGRLGHVSDFLFHASFWKIRYMVVETRSILPGDKVIVALRWIQGIDWGAQRVHVDLEKKSIENAPAYHPDQPLTPEYENELYNYYGRPYD
jgi:hypothetical protein